MREKYLKQAVTGRVYVWSPVLAARSDMAEYDPEMAETRIRALKRRLEELNNMPIVQGDTKMVDEAAEIHELERQIEEKEAEQLKAALKEQGIEVKADLTPDEIEAKRVEKILSEDPDMQKIDRMNSKADVAQYLEEEFGVVMEVDKTVKLDVYKTRAKSLRAERLLEGE